MLLNFAQICKVNAISEKKKKTRKINSIISKYAGQDKSSTCMILSTYAKQGDMSMTQGVVFDGELTKI
jgi:hypothetical protein